MIKAILISVAFLVGFFLIVKRAFDLAFGKKYIKKTFSKRWLYVFVAIMLIGLLVVIHITSQNSGIYAWDSGGYWVWSYKHTNQLFGAPNEALQNLNTSIIETDYNMILPTIISLPLKIFGYTFLRYVCINYVLFLVPAIFILLCIFMKLTEKNKNKTIRFVVGILTVVSLAVSSISILQGYIDVAIMIPIALIFALTISYNPTAGAKEQIHKSLMIGLLLSITFLFRRYTAFFLVGYILTMAIYTAYLILATSRKKKLIKPLIKNALLNALFIILPPLIILLGLFNGLIIRILGEDYSTLYSAYDDTLGGKILTVIAHFGLVILGIILSGIIYAFVKKKNQKMVFFCSCSCIITTILFFRVQSMNGHHIYTLTSQVYILLFLGLFYLLSMKKLFVLKIVCIIAVLLSSAGCLSSRVYNITRLTPLAFQKHYVNVLHRSDIDTIRAIRDYLNGKNPDGKTVYVLSSSVVFNSDTLMVMERPEKDNAVNGLVKSHDVDLRDGFPTVFFDAEIVVTTTPVGTHLLDGSQQIITYLGEQVQNANSYLGRHYKQDPVEYQIGDGFTVQIYYRTSDLTESDYDAMCKYYDDLYPEQKTIFHDRIEQAKTEHLQS